MATDSKIVDAIKGCADGAKLIVWQGVPGMESYSKLIDARLAELAGGKKPSAKAAVPTVSKAKGKPAKKSKGKAESEERFSVRTEKGGFVIPSRTVQKGSDYAAELADAIEAFLVDAPVGEGDFTYRPKFNAKGASILPYAVYGGKYGQSVLAYLRSIG